MYFGDALHFQGAVALDLLINVKGKLDCFLTSEV